jgi:hypothetical protein
MFVELHKVGSKTNCFSVNLVERPSKVTVEPSGDQLFLHWDATVDDSDRLRRCIICSGDLYRERAFPQITGVVIAFAFAGGIAGVAGFLTTWIMFSAMILVLLLDVAILIFDKPRLVCYECDTKFKETPIAPQFHTWDQHHADQITRSQS